MTYSEFEKIVASVPELTGAVLDYDNQGQIVIYTGLTTTNDNNIREMIEEDFQLKDE